jgi:hypothetical protein
MQRYGSATGLSLFWQRVRYTQVFLGANDEPVSVAIHANNPDCSPLNIQS